ncbi:hypothetical protein Q9R46_14610 [Paenibacillus sp. RRE4]|uniref:hypothetical protein n=1 Tax=Paenibacillus sp. RRE4 TaxID=2962587 RepID=UPI0028827C00|nr:hypothetical protein [Paenibacillus sp. RRE4]MDT0123890.1 hypothetical protein [Paenibacillus sp. RRE4]
MKKSGSIFWIAAFGVLVCWIFTWIFIPMIYKESEFGAGTFGDMFGGVNALFSGLAFVGLIYTILLQKQDLALQTKAIKDQTTETTRTANELERQRKLLYFQLVVAHVNELIAIKNKKIAHLIIEINYKGSITVYRGITGITELVRKNQSSDKKYYPNLKQWMDSFFYILQYIIDSELEDTFKNSIVELVFIEVSESEVHVLYGMNRDDKHRIELLDRFRLRQKM